ncbi:MAG: AAA family ATPase [Pseudomonadota bacterium]
MLLTSIRLSNVRRFSEPVEIAGFGQGVNVLTAPNEHGKSTVFDALHAAFFASHRSMNAEVRSLVPFAGGDPEVTVDFRSGDTEWRLEKRWSTTDKRKAVRLWRDGTLLAQAGEAEDRLSGLLATPSDGGPAGLLWVRQGVTELADKGPEETTRQTLLSSVAGEVDAMTGGRQMDALRSRVAADLGRLLTSTGRVRKDGPLDAAEKAVASLDEAHAGLLAASEVLRSDLAHRTRIRAELRQLSDPEDAAARQAALTASDAALERGQRHRMALQAAKEAERAATVTLSNLEQARARLAQALDERKAAQAALAAAGPDLEHAQNALSEREGDWRDLAARAEDARRAAQTAREGYRRASAADRARSLAAERAALVERLKQAERARTAAEAARAEAGTGPSPQALDQLRKLAAQLAAARQARNRAAPAVTVHYGGAGRVYRAGQEVPEGTRTPFPDGAELTLDGIGTLILHPGDTSGPDEIGGAEQALARALSAVGHADLEGAEKAAALRSAATERAAEAETRLQVHAPDGIEQLRTQLAALPDPPDEAAPELTTAEAAEAEQAAMDAMTRAEAALRAAAEKREAAHAALARSEAARTAAAERTGRADAALAGHADPAADLAQLNADIARGGEEAHARRHAREGLDAYAPDLATLTARRDRAAQAVENAREDVHRLTLKRTELDTRIEAQAGTAIEENLADAAERLAAARRRRDVLLEERDVLLCLAAALDTARSAARERYLAPVLREIDPLVRMVFPEAELTLDPDTVLPTNLVRRGTEEPFALLSGGTREQIALLVRLAFARMLARDGRPAPVILDDAIVYSDDERIVTMFDALTRQAADLQVIVFSCRSRAFRDLGGRSLSIVPSTSETSL